MSCGLEPMRNWEKSHKNQPRIATNLKRNECSSLVWPKKQKVGEEVEVEIG